MIFNAGQLDKQIALKSKVVTRDALGGEVITYASIATVWSKVDWMDSSYFSGAERENMRKQANFTIRYRSDINANDIIEYRGMEWTILSIKEVGTRDSLLVLRAGVIDNS